jgi:hypothetical protein
MFAAVPMSDSSHGTLKQEGIVARKGSRREEIVERILNALTDDDIYENRYVERLTENKMKDPLYSALVDCMEGLYEDLGGVTKQSSIEERARESVLWESSPKTTINNIKFMGVQHRPDFVVQFDDLRIAVEVKLGDRGADIREGLGQSLVYAAEYDFVAYLFIDTSGDKKIQLGCEQDVEQQVLDSLWSNYNIKFAVV